MTWHELTPDSLVEFERRWEVYQSSVLPMCHAEGNSMQPHPHRPTCERSSLERLLDVLAGAFALVLTMVFAVMGIAMVLWILMWVIWQ